MGDIKTSYHKLLVREIPLPALRVTTAMSDIKTSTPLYHKLLEIEKKPLPV